MGICAVELNQNFGGHFIWSSSNPTSSQDAIGGAFKSILSNVKEIFVDVPQHKRLDTETSSGAFSKYSDQSWLTSADIAGVYRDNLVGVAEFAYRQKFHSFLSSILHAGISNAPKIASRLTSLLEMAIEDEPNNGAPICLESVNALVQFFVGAEVKTYPDIALTPDGNLFCGWFDRERNCSLQLVFLENGIARVLWIHNSLERIPRKNKVNATMDIHSAILFLKTNKALPL